MNCRQLLQRGFVGCCLMAAGTGFAVGISCELRKRPDCREQWDQGSKAVLAAAGLLSTALARFGDVGAE